METKELYDKNFKTYKNFKYIDEGLKDGNTPLPAMQCCENSHPIKSTLQIQ